MANQREFRFKTGDVLIRRKTRRTPEVIVRVYFVNSAGFCIRHINGVDEYRPFSWSTVKFRKADDGEAIWTSLMVAARVEEAS